MDVRTTTAPSLVLACVFYADDTSVTSGFCQNLFRNRRISSTLSFWHKSADTGGISYLLEDTFQFKPGMQHTLSLTINSNPDQIEIEIGGDIEDGNWE